MHQETWVHRHLQACNFVFDPGWRRLSRQWCIHQLFAGRFQDDGAYRKWRVHLRVAFAHQREDPGRRASRLLRRARHRGAISDGRRGARAPGKEGRVTEVGADGARPVVRRGYDISLE